MRIATTLLAFLATALVALAAAAAGPAQATTIDEGTIRVGRGVEGATLGMTRAEVAKALGKPDSENANGVMSYQDFEDPDSGIFDIYRDLEDKTVRTFIVSFPGSRDWKLQDGNPVFTRGFVDRLYRAYGKRVHRRTLQEDGVKQYYLVSRYRGRRVETIFDVDRFSRTRARVLNAWVLFAS